jgi:hypothetical protein
LVCSKIARFEHELGDIEREAKAYRTIDGHNIGPQFLGHLTEYGRMIGILLDYIPNSRHGTIADLGICLAVLRRLHEFKILLDDVNRNNFLVSADGERAMISDFANSEVDTDDVRLKEEEDQLLASLESDELDEEEVRWDIYGQHRFTEVPPSEYRI